MAIRHLVTSTFVLLLIFVASNSQTIDDDEIRQRIDEFIEQAMQCASIPGITLSVVKDNQDFMAKGYGVQDLVEQERVTNETLFLLASVTKAMTGARVTR